MKVARSVPDLRAALAGTRRAGKRIAFVPTMGALHAGHVSLIDRANDVADEIVVSIFVNPLQFGPNEDHERYPRDETGDLAKCESAGAAVAFLPSVDEMYPAGRSTVVEPGSLGEILEGAFRTGHFAGVCTVVATLLNVVQPDVAVFGQKDAQQVAVIRRMVADLLFPVELLVAPTIREPDGLALSSRNSYLSPAEREVAPALYRSLLGGREALLGGAGPEVVEKNMREALEAAGFGVDYASAVDPETFRPASGSGPTLLVTAARLGSTRLIDNLIVEADAEAEG